MLSRVADSLYWMSRCLERAEHTARLLDVNLTQMLDQTGVAASRRWERLLASLMVTLSTPIDDDALPLVHALTDDPRQPASIMANIALARENARQVREQISSEMWEQLNRLYWAGRQLSEAAWQSEPHRLYQLIKEGSHLFQGITDATLSHGEGWHFIQLGRAIERAGATATLLDVHFRALSAPPSPGVPAPTYLDWVGLLKSCTAFEAYCKVYTADVQPPRVAEFLLLNYQSPRSVRYAVETIQTSLQAIAAAGDQRRAGQAERLAGRLRASLRYAQIDELLADDMHSFLGTIQRQCAQLHLAIQQTYIDYPIEAELVT